MQSRAFRAKIGENGKVLWHNPEAVSAYTKGYKVGSEVVISFKNWVPSRSLPQNAYFHGVVLPMMADAMGLDVAEAKEALKAHLLPVWIGEGDHQIKACRATSSLNTAEFTKFVEDCRRLGAEFFGLNIPDPIVP